MKRSLLLVSLTIILLILTVIPGYSTPRTGRESHILTSEPAGQFCSKSGDERTRNFDWAEWIDGNNPISIDGNPDDWSSYTPHAIGSGSNVVNLYMANDNSHLNICIDAISDITDNEQVNDVFEGFFDGDNDNAVPQCLAGEQCNENSKDSWFSLCGDRDKQSDANGCYNDAGLINRRNDNGQICLWYNQGSWIDDWGYQWRVGFNGDPQQHMVYEIKIPFSKWNWHSGDQIGVGFQVSKAAGGNPSSIGKYPAGFTLENIGGWKDIHLATQNDRPYYSNPKANPSTIYNDGINETLLTAEVMDSDGSISEVTIDLTSIGGGSSVQMADDGSHGDASAGDEIYSYRTTVSTTAEAGVKDLSFEILDDHTPNVGSARGEIRLTVIQANRPPYIKDNAVNRKILEEDQEEAFYTLEGEVFDDYDENDVLTYGIWTNSSWNSHHTTALAAYRILMNGSLKIVPIPDRSGTEAVLIRATDAEGLSVDSAFSLTVVIQPRNDAPRLLRMNGTDILGSSVALEGYEDLWTEYVFDAEDIDGDELDFFINISDYQPLFRKNHDYVFHRDNGTFLINPKNHHVGKYQLRLTVEDGNDGEDHVDIELTIRNSNDRPVLDKISTMSVDQDALLKFTPTVSDEDIPWGDTLTFSTNLTEQVANTVANENYSFDTSTGELCFRPNKDTILTYYTYIRVEDASHASNRRDFKIIVIDSKNDAPETPTIESVTVEGNLTVQFIAGNIRDPDGDEIFFKWDFGDGTVGPSKAEVEHTYEESGTYIVSLMLGDIYDAYSDTRTLAIDVKGPDDGDEPVKKDLIMSGKVKDADGNPLASVDILIEWLDDPRINYTVRTGPDGHFELSLPEGNYYVTARKEGFEEKSEGKLMVKAGGNDPMVLELKRKSSPSGRVSDQTALLNLNLLWILLAAVALIIIALICLMMIRRKKKRWDDTPTPHRILMGPQQSTMPPMQPPGPPPGFGFPARAPHMPPAMQYKALPPAPAQKAPPPTYSPDALMSGDIPVRSPGKASPAAVSPTSPPRSVQSGEPKSSSAKKGSGKPQVMKLGAPRPPRFQGDGEARGKEELKAAGKGPADAPLLPEARETADPESAKDASSGPLPEDVRPKAAEYEDEGPLSSLFELDDLPSKASSPGPDAVKGADAAEEQAPSISTGVPSDQSDPVSTPRRILEELALEDAEEDVWGEGAMDVEEGPSKSLAISGIFDGLDQESSPGTVPTDDSRGTLAKIPVKRIAISKDTGERLEICEVCGDYFNASERGCPHCGGTEKESKKVTCPSCNAEVGSDMIFCNKCGANLKKVKAVRVDDDAGGDGRIECPKCGKMLRRGMKFCNACGTPVGMKSGAIEAKKPEPSGSDDYLEHVECYNCGEMMPVTTRDRPVIVTCPKCNTQGQLA